MNWNTIKLTEYGLEILLDFYWLNKFQISSLPTNFEYHLIILSKY